MPRSPLIPGGPWRPLTPGGPGGPGGPTICNFQYGVNKLKLFNNYPYRMKFLAVLDVKSTTKVFLTISPPPPTSPVPSPWNSWRNIKKVLCYTFVYAYLWRKPPKNDTKMKINPFNLNKIRMRCTVYEIMSEINGSWYRINHYLSSPELFVFLLVDVVQKENGWKQKEFKN